jgi:hypothetical protein
LDGHKIQRPGSFWMVAMIDKPYDLPQTKAQQRKTPRLHSSYFGSSDFTF